jgi:hypothetical protein
MKMKEHFVFICGGASDASNDDGLKIKNVMENALDEYRINERIFDVHSIASMEGKEYILKWFAENILVDRYESAIFIGKSLGGINGLKNFWDNAVGKLCAFKKVSMLFIDPHYPWIGLDYYGRMRGFSMKNIPSNVKVMEIIQRNHAPYGAAITGRDVHLSILKGGNVDHFNIVTHRITLDYMREAIEYAIDV